MIQTQSERDKFGETEDRAKIMKVRRERDEEETVPLLCPGLKLIGPGLEEIKYKKYTKFIQSPLQVWFPW